MPRSVWSITRLRRRFGAGCRCRRISLRSTEASHGVRANAPEDRNLRGLGLLGFAILSLVLRADEQAVDEEVIAFVEGFCDGLAEAIESHDAVPLGFGLPLFVRVFPRLLGGDGQDGEVRTVAADLPFLGIFSEEADELNVIQIHLFLLFCPISLGHPRAERMLLPRRVAAFREGPKNHRGGTGKAEDAKLPGAGIIPKPCPRKGATEKERALKAPGTSGDRRDAGSTGQYGRHAETLGPERRSYIARKMAQTC